MDIKILKNLNYRVGNIELVEYSHDLTCVMGWATNANNTKPADLVILIDKNRDVQGICEPIYERPDVVTYFRNQNLLKSGWKIIIPNRIENFHLFSCIVTEKTAIEIYGENCRELLENVSLINLRDSVFNEISQEFHNLNDEKWFLLMLESLNGRYIGKCKFPAFATEIIQQNYTGRIGETTLKQAFEFYKEIKKIIKEGVA